MFHRKSTTKALARAIGERTPGTLALATATFFGSRARSALRFGEVTIAEKQEEIVKTLGALPNAQDRLAHIIGRGRAAAPLAPDFKVDAFRLDGCLAKVWFVPELKQGRCYFKADSDSAIVKGIAALLCEFYSGQTPDEITQTPPVFLEMFGITQHLTPNRRSGLARIWSSIEGFARGHLDS